MRRVVLSGKFECCFCGETVDPEQRGSLTCVVAAATSAREPGSPTQQLWFHGVCLGEKLRPNVTFDAGGFTE